METAAQLAARAPISRAQSILRTLAVVRTRERWLKFFAGLTIFVNVGLIVCMIWLAIA
jgi:hypothetical protein